MTERGKPNRAIIAVAFVVAVIVVGAIASAIWSHLSGPTGEPGWIDNLENLTWVETIENSAWFEFLDRI